SNPHKRARLFLVLSESAEIPRQPDAPQLNQVPDPPQTPAALRRTTNPRGSNDQQMPQFGRLPTATVYNSAGCGMTTTSRRYIKTDKTRQTDDIPSSKDHMQQKTHKSPSKSPSAGKRRVRNVCVYCGSNVGTNPAYATAARMLGTTMAKERIGLV